MPKPLKTQIKIKEIEPSETRITIRDYEGNTYSFFKNKQDGSTTKAHETFLSLAVETEKTYIISYSINGKFKNILWFEAGEEGLSVPKSEETSPPSNKEVNWDAINEGKVRHGVVCSMLEANRDVPYILENAPTLVNYIWTGETLMPNKVSKVDDGAQPPF